MIVARAAASQAAYTAAAATGTEADGEEAARTIIDELGGLRNVSVEVTRGRTARATVSGYPLGLKFAPVTVVAERTVSGFRPASDR